jgi:acyl carrier protein
MPTGSPSGPRGGSSRTPSSTPRPTASPGPCSTLAGLTGDLGRLRADGCLELVGRRDARLKIHGANVDPTEIELTLHEISGVTQAAVVVREREPGDPRLVAYVAAGSGAALTAAEMRRHLKERLPDSMIPAAFVTLPALPASPNGKVDRRALPDPDWSRSAPFVAPRSPMEQVLADMWAEALQTTAVGVSDGFFELGGDSLRAFRLVAAIRDRFQLDVPPVALLAAGTVAEMAVAVMAAQLESLPAADRDRLLEGVDGP